MGSGSSKNGERFEERRTGQSIEIDLDSIMKDSACKIIGNNSNGTGFFVIINNELKCLLSCYHVISREMNHIDIILYNNKRINIQLKNRFIKYYEKEDITLIEIKDNDDIIKDIDFLNYDPNYLNGNEQYINKDIYSLQYRNEKIKLYTGKITEISNKNEFKHNIDTDFGSSGCPIILVGISKVIGIHKQGDRYQPINYGSFIGDIIKENNNYIIGEIYINKENIGKEIRIINSYDEYLRDHKRDLDIGEFSNEKEIKECIIEINNEIFPSFSYKYRFKNEGIYKIKYTFKNLLTNCSDMFYECYELTSLNLSNFNSKNIIYIHWMLSNCKNLTNINLSNFNTQNVINMSGMFSNCNNLKNLDVSTFNTQNVNDMSYMFFKCSSLKDLNLSNFNIQNVNDMSSMFSDCSCLTNLNLSSFNTRKDIKTNYIFSNCKELKSINTKNERLNDELKYI